MRYAPPVDGWSAYYALLTDALSASPRSAPRSYRDAPAVPPTSAPQIAAKPRRSLMERLDNWFSDQRTRARERYLAESSDLCELETRMREINRYY